MVIGDTKKHPLASLAEGGIELDAEGNVIPYRLLYATKPDGAPVKVTATVDGKLIVGGAGIEFPSSGSKTVTLAGTAEALGGDVNCRSLIIIADPDNSGNIYVGDSEVDDTGAKLPPGGILPCGAVNLSEIFIDADVSGEGISYYYTR